MTVTEQQQLKWLVGFIGGCYVITQEEWQQEREKAINELNALVGDIEKYPTWRDAIAGIIDYGYRKVKP